MRLHPVPTSLRDLLTEAGIAIPDGLGEVTVKGISADPLDFFAKSDVDALSKDPAVESGASSETTGMTTDTSAVTKPNGK